VKVVELGAKQKACPYCGKQPECPDFTCERIAAVSFDPEGGGWTIEFVDTSPPVGDEPQGQ
jgi:hypothetical protein